jgi:hypothetical protein
MTANPEPSKAAEAVTSKARRLIVELAALEAEVREFLATADPQTEEERSQVEDLRAFLGEPSA